MNETDQDKLAQVGGWTQQHWKLVAFLILAAALVITGLLLHHAQSRRDELRRELAAQEEQLERQNELIAALKAKEEENAAKETNIVITSDTIEQQLNSIRELVTQEYFYTNADKRESSEEWVFGWARPFSGKSILITYDGIIKAGVDLSGVQITVDEEAHTITVVLPPSKITENNIPQEKIQVLEVKDGLFNPFTFDNFNEFIADQKVVMEQKAIDQGILTKADEETAALVKSFLSILPGMENYTLDIRQAQ